MLLIRKNEKGSKNKDEIDQWGWGLFFIGRKEEN